MPKLSAVGEAWVFEMRRRLPALLLVHGITASRLGTAILLAAISHRVGGPIILSLYIFALSTDWVDGYLARKFDVASEFGHVFDLIADKSLVAVSLLYAASLGIEILPLALIGLRDLIMLGMRALGDPKGSLLPTSRRFGALLLCGVVALTVTSALYTHPEVRQVCLFLYWTLATVASINIVWRVGPMMRKLSL